MDALKKAKALLKQFHQSVLKHAFEGKLSEKWRNTHETKSVDFYLDSLKEDKRRLWKGKFKEITPLDTFGLPQLPTAWKWITLEEILESNPTSIKAGPFGSSLKKEYYVSHGYKIYGQEQVIRGDPFYGNYYIDEQRYQSLRSCSVKTGDILITLVGTIGRALVLPNGIEPGIINPRLAKISVDKRFVNSNYIKSYLESSSVRHYLSTVSHGGTMEILNLGIIKRLPIPLPPLSEQEFLMKYIQHNSSMIYNLREVIQQIIKYEETLYQSILNLAFEGKLVSHDPSDEPASLLLQKIRE